MVRIVAKIPKKPIRQSFKWKELTGMFQVTVWNVTILNVRFPEVVRRKQQ